MKPLFAMLPAVCLASFALGAGSASAPVRAAPRAGQRWLLVSDIHLNPFDRQQAPSAYGSDSNWALWISTLRAMREADPRPALVIVSGDFLAHHFGELVRAHGGSGVRAAAVKTMARIAGSLDEAFPNARFAIALGNNDDPCGDYRTAPNSAYRAALARIWEPLVDRNGAAPDFERTFTAGGYYVASLPMRGVRAIVLDDVFWSLLYRPCGQVRGTPARGELDWLRRTLASTPARTRNVLVAHIPPGVDTAGTLFAHRFAVIPFLNLAEEDTLLRDVHRERARIAFAIAGHTHRMDFRTLAAVPMLIAPSVSPIYGNDPAFLRLRVAPDGTLRDYALYAYDPAGGRWSVRFDFDRAYGAAIFDTASLARAHARIQADAVVRRRWAGALVAGSPLRDVGASNWRAVWCAQTLTGSRYAACAHLRRRLLVLPIAAALLLLVVVASAASIVLRITASRRR